VRGVGHPAADQPGRSGAGSVETALGVIGYRTGDSVLVPRAVDPRWVPSEPSRLSPIAASSHITPPRRYLSRFGQLLEHAPYCERDLHGPDAPFLVEGTDVEVLVKHRAGGRIVGSRLTYATHPFDVVGWDGCLYPLTFNVEDYMPITGKVHQPPPVHQVFEGWNFVVCNFVPRKVDYHPLAIPVPYYHSNVDSDEVMFYVGGDYEARKGSGINLGSISLHPGGYAHGPQPSAIEASLGAEYFDESAVMVDTFAALELGEGGVAAEDPAYAWTWAGRGPDSSPDGASESGDGGPAVYSNS
jgi:homogentisate 1,2-dioxygenase